MPATPRAALYCRLSKEDAEKQQESESIQNQKALLLDYAGRQGWEVCAVFADEDYSGADRRRPGFQAMLRAAQAGEFDILLCKTQSRFARDLELIERYIHGLFPLWGIRFVAVVDNEDTARKGNKKARQISGLINEWYLEDLSENVRAVLDLKRRSGQFIGSFAPYGYRKDPGDHNRLLADPPAAGTVRRIFRLFLDGYGKKRIAQLLNASGVPCPARYKAGQGQPCPRPEQETGRMLWSASSVGRILKSAVYAGDLVQGTRRKASYKSDRLLPVPPDSWIVFPNAHQALVPREQFEQVQQLLRARTRASRTGSPHLLAGKVRCLGCKSPLVKTSSGSGDAKRDYLHCKLHAQDKTLCSSHSIRLDLLETAVSERLFSHLRLCFSPGELDALLHSRPEEPAENFELERLAGERVRYENALRLLHLDRVDGLISREQFATLSRSYLAQTEQLSRRIARLEETPAAGQSGQPPTLNRALICALIDRIEVGQRDPMNGTQEVLIFWNF